jgi:hypothetical protein
MDRPPDNKISGPKQLGEDQQNNWRTVECADYKRNTPGMPPYNWYLVLQTLRVKIALDGSGQNSSYGHSR